ncbi:MAG: thioredoxin-like domain-containing protein [Treponemataceae bacterium]
MKLIKPYKVVPALFLLFLMTPGTGYKAVSAQTVPQEKSWAGTNSGPEFPSGLEWLNVSAPLTLDSLKGKVVLLDFWTYGCVNCMHNLPYLKRLEEEFSKELVIIGVHSAKFATEGKTDNLRNIALRYGLTYPIVNDSEFAVWKLWGPTGWPTLVLIDPAGKVVGGSSGEGFYDTFRQIIISLIKEFDAKKRIDRTPLASALERDRAPASVLSFPGKVRLDPERARLFIADSGHNRLVVASTADSSVIDVIGSGEAGFADGTFEAARFANPQGMALSEDGSILYVADTDNHSIRAVDMKARTVATLVGTGKQAEEYPPEAGVGTKVALSSPWDLVRDGKTLYVAMAGSHQIWTIDIGTGVAAPVAGSGAEGYLDKSGDKAELAQPSGLTLAPAGTRATDGQSLYFADSEASSIRRLDLNTAGDPVITVAGSGKSLFEFGAEDGKGTAARFQHPLGLVWTEGAVFVADTYNHRIRRIDPSTGMVTTVAGRAAGYRNGKETAFNEPGGIDAAGGKLYLADTNNHTIRVFDLKKGEASSLVFKGFERFTRGFVVAAAEPIVLPEQTVGVGKGEIRLSIDLPPGYKPNPEAASSFSFRVEGTGADINGPAEIIIAGPSFPITIPANFAVGKGKIVVEVSLVYCESVNETLCLLERRTVEIPFQVKKGSPTNLEVRYDAGKTGAGNELPAGSTTSSSQASTPKLQLFEAK